MDGLEERLAWAFGCVELCPRPEEKSSDFLAAKLYYKMLSYKFEGTDKDDEFESNFNEAKKGVSKFNTEEDV